MNPKRRALKAPSPGLFGLILSTRARIRGAAKGGVNILLDTFPKLFLIEMLRVGDPRIKIAARCRLGTPSSPGRLRQDRRLSRAGALLAVSLSRLSEPFVVCDSAERLSPPVALTLIPCWRRSCVLAPRP